LGKRYENQLGDILSELRLLIDQSQRRGIDKVDVARDKLTKRQFGAVIYKLRK
jgi:hypothetical protein